MKSIAKKLFIAGFLTVCLVVPILSSTKVSNNGITVYDISGDVSENY